ncbi:MAG: NTP transferase domain-containing protein [Burkholderiales bacterium]
MSVAQAEQPVRRAVILAAGRGSRMGGLTDAKPKCLIELAGKTLLDWQIQALAVAGITENTLVTGYLEHLLRDAHPRAITNARWRETNMIRSLMCARELLSSFPAVVGYADILYHPSALRALLATRSGIALVYDTMWEELWRERFADPLADAESFHAQDGWVVDIGRRISRPDEANGQYMGLLLFRPEGWVAVEGFLAGLAPSTVDRLDMTGMLRQMVSAGTRIEAVSVAGGWCEVDSASDIALYERRLAEQARGGRPWAHDWRAGDQPA